MASEIKLKGFFGLVVEFDVKSTLDVSNEKERKEMIGLKRNEMSGKIIFF